MTTKSKRSLSEIVSPQREKISSNKKPNLPYVGLEQIAQGQPELLGTLSSEQSTSTNAVFQSGDILFGKLRPNLRKSLQVHFDGYCSTDILVLRAIDGVVPEFAARVFQQEEVFEAAVRFSIGTKMPRVNWTDLKELEVFVPFIREEQRTIAAILETIDAAIQNVERVIAKQKAIRAGLLEDLLTYGLDVNGEPRDPLAHPMQFKESPLGLIPVEWEVVRIYELGQIQLGLQRSPSRQRGEHIKPYLRVANVFDGWIDYSDVLEMNFTPVEQQSYTLVPGDILLNEGQSLELVGRCAIYDGPPNTYCFQNTLIRLRANDRVIPAFCRIVFKQYLDNGSFMRVALQTTSVAHLGADRFANMLFSLPNLDEQRLIVERVAAGNRVIEASIDTRNKLIAKKKGLMDDLLTGRVRVGDVRLNEVMERKS